MVRCMAWLLPLFSLCGDVITYLPHYTVREGLWNTEMSLSNPTAANQEITMLAYSNQGDFLTSIDVDLPALGGLAEPFENLFPGLGVDVGWLEIQSDTSNVKGIMKFTFLPSGGTSSLPMIEEAGTRIIFPLLENTFEWTSGFALTNISDQPIQVTMRLADFEGTFSRAIQMHLAPRNKVVTMLADLFGADLPEKMILTAESSAPITGFALSFKTGNSNIVAVPGTLWTQSIAITRNQALYVTASDGTKIATEVWLPQGLAVGATIPTVIRFTREWRAFETVGLPLQSDPNYEEAERFNSEGYAYVIVDVRGSGASFGNRPIPGAQNEVTDSSEIIDLVVAQSWSNGKVGVYGDLYGGFAAERLAALNHPAVRAIVPRFSPFDIYSDLIFPGGVRNDAFLRLWSERNQLLDANDEEVVCLVFGVEGIECEQLQSSLKGVKPVDFDQEKELLALAVAEHQTNQTLDELTESVDYRNDILGARSSIIDDFSAHSYLTETQRSGAAIYSWGSWMAGTSADSALARFRSISNPQKVIIGAWNHGATHQASSFTSPDQALNPNVDEQFQLITAFFDQILKGSGDPSAFENEVRYYTMGEERWHTSSTWPPSGVEDVAFYFASDQQLSTEAPQGESSDSYTPQLDAGTGESSRWSTQYTGFDVFYSERGEAESSLITYTSAPLSQSTTITGNPIVHLYLASSQPDATLHVYLSAIDQDDNSIYITEGVFKARHARVSDKIPDYTAPGPFHSFESGDQIELDPVTPVDVGFALLATSAQIPAGYRLRLSIAATDINNFDVTTPTQSQWTIHRSQGAASHVTIPVEE